MSVKVGLRFWTKIAACGLFLGSLLPVSVQAQTLSWKQQLGSSGFDTSKDVATDSKGNVYITGSTDGSLAGTNNAGIDAFVAKYNPSGTLVWKQQLGLFGPDVFSNSVATDSNGNVYISGETNGSLAGDIQGTIEAFVAKYNPSGNLVWKRQLSSSFSSKSVATDSDGNVYISGGTTGALAGTNNAGTDTADAYVAKYNSSGERLWKRQLGSSMGDASSGVATDSNGNVYIIGDTIGSLAGEYKGEFDVFVAKYNSSGTLVWKRQLGTSGYEYSYGVATDSKGNVYISGETNGSLAGPNKAGIDAFVAKYNPSGTLVWKQQLGLFGPDVLSYSVATDSIGNVYISGETDGSLTGANKRGTDPWVAKYNTSGALVWKQQLGTNALDMSFGVATDSIGNVYISGYTNGSLGGPYQGGSSDAFVVKFTQ